MSQNKNIDDLRAAMFSTINALTEGKITPEQARAASDIGKVLIDTAKVEVEYLRVAGGGSSSFLEPEGSAPSLPNGVVGIRKHRLQG